MKTLAIAPLVGYLALAISSALTAATYEVATRHPEAADDGPGTQAKPWKTLSKAARQAGPGDLVVVRGGIYREHVLVKTSGTAEAPIRFAVAPGEYAVVTGADPLSRWEKVDSSRPIYQTPWPHRFIPWNRNMTHPDDEYHRVIGRCEQVLVEEYLLRQVLAADQLAPGTFFVNLTNQTLLAWDAASRDLNKVQVEASVRQEVFRVGGDHVQLRGFHFRYAANMAQHGGVVLSGHHDLMEDCSVEMMNASGAAFTGEDTVVRRCVFRDNGQLGFGAGGAHRLLFTESAVENNNTKGFSRGWEAGGDKLVLCRDAVLERSRFVRNHGNGIWFDIGNTNCTVRNCLVADNEDAGIFYEISFALHAHDNVITGNGFAETAGAWGAQAGISLSSSPGCVIEQNLIVGNREGFNFREQMRTTRTIDDRKERPVWNHDERIAHNVIAFNRDAQVWGWFDVRDGRHWPAESAAAKQPAAGETGQPENIAADYLAKNDRSQPSGLTLAKLHLRFDDNIYFASPGQNWFHWGPTWARHKSYGSLDEFRAELGVDAGGQALDPGFADLFQRDFRLQPEVRAQLGPNYPRGLVPGVQLGEQP